MEERGFDGLVVTGPSANNPIMYYMTNGAKLGEGTVLLKKRGESPVLIASDMEREEAAKSGLTIVPFSHFDLRKIFSEEKGDRLQASVRLWETLFDEHGLSGNISLYGREEQGQAIVFSKAFNARNDSRKIVGEITPTIFETAWVTKDQEEVERIRRVGLKTVEVVDRTAKLLQSHPAQNKVLVKEDGSPLTVGDVKRHIRVWLAELDLEDPEGVIFAIGRDAGIPHSTGEDADPIELGKTIIYDIFPREPGAGYFYDFTRTWSLGYATPEAQALYERALAIRRDALGPYHPMVAQSLNNLSSLYRELGRHEEAEQFSTQAVAIAEGIFGPDHYRITNCLNNLGAVYAARGRYADAEQCFQRTLTIRRRFFGDNDPTVATTLCGLAELAVAQAKHAEAEPLFQRALIIREEKLGVEHPGVATVLEKFALLMRQTAREAEAKEMETRAREIRAKQ